MTTQQLPTAVRERGYAHDPASGNFWNNIQEEQLPEFRWPASVITADRMRKQDAQVSSVLRAVTSPILRTGWALDDTGVEPEIAAQISEDLGLPIRGKGPLVNRLRGRDRFSWHTHCRLALTMLPMGHSVFEQLYRFDEERPEIARLRKLGFRPARSIAKWNVARDGGLISIEQRAITNRHTGVVTGASSSDGATLPVNRLVVYSLEREGGNWWGQSILRPAYKNWILKDDGLRTWSIALARNGMGIPVNKAATNVQVDIDAGLETAARVRAGDDSGISVGADGDFKLVGVEGKLVDPKEFIAYQDEQIARAVLAHFLNLGSQTGSWALGSTFADFFTLSLQAIAEEVRDTATNHIVEDIVDLNYGPTVAAPRIVFEEIGSRSSIDGELAQLRRQAGLEDDKDLARFIDQNIAA